MSQFAPSAHDVLRLSVESHVHYRTINRYFRGESVREATVLRITDAARKLKLPLLDGKVPAIPATDAA